MFLSPSSLLFIYKFIYNKDPWGIVSEKGEQMSIVEYLKVILLGIVEGITEWLPISSTGHMILVDEFIHLDV